MYGFCVRQSRHTLPAWYGVGSGIAHYTRDEPDRIKELQSMYQEWPFFRTFLSNVQVFTNPQSLKFYIARALLAKY